MAVLGTLLEITVYSAIIFSAIMLIKTCFKEKMSPFLQYALWSILILRLMLPVTIESPVRLIALPETTQATEETAQGAQKRLLDFTIPSIRTYQNNNVDLENVNTPSESTKQDNDIPTMTTPASQLKLPQILFIVWLSGTTVCLSYFTALALILKKKINHKPILPAQRLSELLEQVKAELGIRANLKMVCQDGYGTPALLFPRTVYLPLRTLAAMDYEQIRNCLRHECMHYKRGDQFINLFLLLLNAIYWFNPCVWAAFYQIRRDMESACDSAVVRHMKPHARRDYATLILGLFSQEKQKHVALGMMQGSTKKIAEQRIKGIFMKNCSGKSMKLITSILSAILFITCFTTACQPTPDKPVVIGKGDNLSSLIQSTPNTSNSVSQNSTSSLSDDTLYTKLEAPKHWSLKETALDKKLNITAEVDIELPGVSKLPAATASLSEFTQEDLDKIVNVLGVKKGAVWSKEPIYMTKERIQQCIIDHQERLW